MALSLGYYVLNIKLHLLEATSAFMEGRLPIPKRCCEGRCGETLNQSPNVFRFVLQEWTKTRNRGRGVDRPHSDRTLLCSELDRAATYNPALEIQAT